MLKTLMLDDQQEAEEDDREEDQKDRKLNAIEQRVMKLEGGMASIADKLDQLLGKKGKAPQKTVRFSLCVPARFVSLPLSLSLSRAMCDACRGAMHREFRCASSKGVVPGLTLLGFFFLGVLC